MSNCMSDDDNNTVEPGSEASVKESECSEKKPDKGFSPKARHKARSFLLQAVYQWQVNKGPIYALEAQFRAEFDMKGSDTEYFHELLNGVLTHTAELDQLYEPYLDRKLENIDMIEKAILRIGTYELKYRLDVPYQVVLNEAIELAKIFGAEESHKYVNSILDRLSQRVRRTEFEAYRQRRQRKPKP